MQKKPLIEQLIIQDKSPSNLSCKATKIALVIIVFLGSLAGVAGTTYFNYRESVWAGVGAFVGSALLVYLINSTLIEILRSSSSFLASVNDSKPGDYIAFS